MTVNWFILDIRADECFLPHTGSGESLTELQTADLFHSAEHTVSSAATGTPNNCTTHDTMIQ